MNFLTIQRLVGVLLTLFSMTMVPPVIVSWWFQDGAIQSFLSALLFVLCLGLGLWLPVRREQRELRLRDGFIVVVLFWTALGASGSIPLMLVSEPRLSITDAVFESVSGLTTTGATVIVGLEDLPESILFYRQLLQWLGGMGIIVLAVAVLPMLGIGGMQLYRAETPGPMKDHKLTPRITETAKALWMIYMGLTIACTLGYLLAGMTLFDAVAHAFSTVAIGGFSTYDASLGHFDSIAVELVAVVFMLLAGVNFSLHFMALRSRQLRTYLRDAEFRLYAVLLIGLTLVCILLLRITETFGGFPEAARYGLFQAVSIATTTGFTTAGYYEWPSFLPVLLLFASFVGGCAGSVGGGLKVIRVLLLLKQGVREVIRLIHPNAEVSIKVGGSFMPYRVIDAVWGFFAAYVATFALLMIGTMATGLDQVTAFSAVAACMNNLGPGLGQVGAHYGDINDAAKWMLAAAMLLGRLEVFTVLVILSPAFWRG